MDLFNLSGAEFEGEARKYRYVLWRIWDPDKPVCGFIGLNPSTADDITDDPTIRRVKRFASDWGYGGVYMLNIFAFVTPYPHILAKCPDPVKDNDKWLVNIGQKCDKIIFCWGAFKEAESRAREVEKLFTNPFCLNINYDGSPRHPLYVPRSQKPIRYERN